MVQSSLASFKLSIIWKGCRYVGHSMHYVWINRWSTFISRIEWNRSTLFNSKNNRSFNSRTIRNFSKKSKIFRNEIPWNNKTRNYLEKIFRLIEQKSFKFYLIHSKNGSKLEIKCWWCFKSSLFWRSTKLATLCISRKLIIRIYE